MTLRHLNYTIDESRKPRSDEQAGGTESPSHSICQAKRPNLRELFNARWDRNKAGYRLLAGR